MRGDFTLSYHFYEQLDSRNHLELFLDLDGKSAVETWRSFGKTPTPRRFMKAPEHRRIYLTFSGQISNGRGRLRILRRGKFIDRRTRMSEGCAAHEVHQSAARRTRARDTIKVIL